MYDSTICAVAQRTLSDSDSARVDLVSSIRLTMVSGSNQYAQRSACIIPHNGVSSLLYETEQCNIQARGIKFDWRTSTHEVSYADAAAATASFLACVKADLISIPCSTYIFLIRFCSLNSNLSSFVKTTMTGTGNTPRYWVCVCAVSKWNINTRSPLFPVFKNKSKRAMSPPSKGLWPAMGISTQYLQNGDQKGSITQRQCKPNQIAWSCSLNGLPFRSWMKLVIIFKFFLEPLSSPLLSWRLRDLLFGDVISRVMSWSPA